MAVRAASVQFIFVTILLDALGIGLLIPVLPDVIRRFHSDATFVNHYFGYFIAVYALMQFLASPVLGSLSDRFGRRPILLMSLLGAGLDYLMMAFAPNLTMLFIGRIISGLTGASMTVASSYMVDISNDKNRSSNFGMIGAAWGIGFILGPSLGGLIGSLGPTAPFLVAAALNLLNFIFGYFILPESLAPENKRAIVLHKLNPFKSLFKILRPSPISVLVFAYFLMFLAGQSHPCIWTLYTQYKFGWTAAQVGMSLSFVGICIASAQGYLTRIVIPRFGEARSLQIGMWFNVIGFALFGIANQGWMMYFVTIIFCLSGIASPSIQSMISRRIPPQEQGELQGSLISMGSLASILAPLLYTNLFAFFTSEQASVKFPGIVYITASTICLLILVLLKFAPKEVATKS